MAETRGRLGSIFANPINHAIPDRRATRVVRERKLWAGDIIAAGSEANFKSTTPVIRPVAGLHLARGIRLASGHRD